MSPMVGNTSGVPTLRLVSPHWQGGYSPTVAELLPDGPFAGARRAYAMDTRVLEAILPPHEGPTEVILPCVDDDPTETEDGIESRSAMDASIATAQVAMSRHAWERLLIHWWRSTSMSMRSTRLCV